MTRDTDDGSTMASVDYRSLISRADLEYEGSIERSEAGPPVGNGRMGSLVWTTPSALKLQLNRVDVYANGGDTMSFNRRTMTTGTAAGSLMLSSRDRVRMRSQIGTPTRICPSTMGSPRWKVTE
ncbi:hypothetical protein ACFFQF_31980 [Haladaptatus pallidirubidus]|uniref:hypothetical protein n=1 Tax=Haladaptatus pallidirubidus TaxID=1008152 RepID=UPI001D10EE5E|nr:hypothetical protein [Haladaptatus pallidirubidus]